MIVQEYQPDTFRRWTGEMLTVVATGEQISAPDVIADTWRDDQLAAVGLFRVTPFAPPEGKVVVGSPTYARQEDGTVTESYEVADAPPPPPPTADELRDTTFKTDPTVMGLVAQLDTATPAQIDSWLTDNVTNLAQARTVLGYVIKAMVLLRRSLH